MTRTAGSAATPGRTARVRRGLAPEATAITEDRRLAALHLRLGSLSLAHAELEDLLRRDALDAAGLADLAEARWRNGDLDGAAAAAADHLAIGGSRPIALVIAAEAETAAGRPAEARAHVEALGATDAAAIDQLFAGMPRRAFWPFAPVATIESPEAPSGPDRPGRAIRAGRSGRTGRAGSGVPEILAESADELSRARDELNSGIADETARGVARLGLVLRLDPALAPAVLDALQPRRDPAALLVRGDAYRLLGRHLEAEAAFHAAGLALDALASDRPA
jgi:tetratricopeptide (TPR) repeat protein